MHSAALDLNAPVMFARENIRNNRNVDFRFSKRGDALIGQKMFEVLEMARQFETQGQRVYHLELGNPRLPPPPELLEGAIRSLRNEDVGYSYSTGHPDLRTAIARLFGANVTEENVIVSPANLIISQFLDLVCDPGDSVVLFTPAFPTYWAAAAHIGLQVDPVELDPANGFDLTEEDVAKAIALRPRAIIVNSANNPTGAVYSRRSLDLLARTCDRIGIWLLSDETYGSICFGKDFYSLAGLDLPRLVVMSSFSKIFSAPGFRTGFAVAHPRVAEKLALSTSTLISCLPIFTQIGCLAAIANLEAYGDKVRRRCARIAARCGAELQGSSNILFGMPRAAFYFFLDIGAIGMDDVTFCRRLLQEKQTAITPGSSFGAAYRRFVRISTCGLEEDVHEGIRRLVAFCREE
jgi:aspartate/methionine/tyrosine aminotransferase